MSSRAEDVLKAMRYYGDIDDDTYGILNGLPRLLADLQAFRLDLSEVTIGADLDFQVERLGKLIERYSTGG